MRPGDLLRQLDRQLLPPLARGMARLGRGPLRLRLLTGVALLCSVAVLVTAVWAADRRPAVDQTVGEVTRVGVVQGQSIPGYVESSRGELRALLTDASGEHRETYALVTMSAYLAPDRLTPALTGVSVAEVFGRLWRPGTQTQIVRIPAFRVPEDVVAGMAQVADRKDEEAREYQARAAEVTGDDAEARELRRWYDSGARVAAEEATAYRAPCSCVYAAVVRGEPVALDAIASRPEVRAVDPAPEVRRLDRTVFTPPLPEQKDVVRPPADASMPAEDAGPGGQQPVSPARSGEPDGPATTAPSAEAVQAPPHPGTPSAGPGTATEGPETPDPEPSDHGPVLDPPPAGDPAVDSPAVDPTPAEAPTAGSAPLDPSVGASGGES